MPPQDCDNSYLLDYIGRHSIMEVDEGWTWKFDDTMFEKFEFGENMHEDLAKLKVRVGVVYGEDSYLFSQEIADFMLRSSINRCRLLAFPRHSTTYSWTSLWPL